ncbi:unnamed protein product [Notodromas monacha]|uniref:Secreted protein n=1 Tax=Notodromas monacha TaxID=399045 RepID=A0A7R9GET8_9CRUS|nr:unnamed protein product [Notodromas monacha]CAG0919990.1 unnamed protein product [Notodromas monacha]
MKVLSIGFMLAMLLGMIACAVCGAIADDQPGVGPLIETFQIGEHLRSVRSAEAEPNSNRQKSRRMKNAKRFGYRG